MNDFDDLEDEDELLEDVNFDGLEEDDDFDNLEDEFDYLFNDDF